MDTELNDLLRLLEKYEHESAADRSDGKCMQFFESKNYFQTFFYYDQMILMVKLTEAGKQKLEELRCRARTKQTIVMVDGLVVNLLCGD